MALLIKKPLASMRQLVLGASCLMIAAGCADDKNQQKRSSASSEDNEPAWVEQSLVQYGLVALPGLPNNASRDAIWIAVVDDKGVGLPNVQMSVEAVIDAEAPSSEEPSIPKTPVIAPSPQPVVVTPQPTWQPAPAPQPEPQIPPGTPVRTTWESAQNPFTSPYTVGSVSFPVGLPNSCSTYRQLSLAGRLANWQRSLLLQSRRACLGRLGLSKSTTENWSHVSTVSSANGLFHIYDLQSKFRVTFSAPGKQDLQLYYTDPLLRPGSLRQIKLQAGATLPPPPAPSDTRPSALEAFNKYLDNCTCAKRGGVREAMIANSSEMTCQDGTRLYIPNVSTYNGSCRTATVINEEGRAAWATIRVMIVDHMGAPIENADVSMTPLTTYQASSSKATHVGGGVYVASVSILENSGNNTIIVSASAPDRLAGGFNVNGIFRGVSHAFLMSLMPRAGSGNDMQRSLVRTVLYRGKDAAGFSNVSVGFAWVDHRRNTLSMQDIAEQCGYPRNPGTISIKLYNDQFKRLALQLHGSSTTDIQKITSGTIYSTDVHRLLTRDALGTYDTIRQDDFFRRLMKSSQDFISKPVGSQTQVVCETAN